MKAEILSIGSEVVIGRIADTNAAWLSQRLTELGYEVTRHTAVGDRRPDVLCALEAARGQASVIIITGGLGPTLDDETRFVLAEFGRVELMEDPRATEHLKGFFARLGRPMTASNMRQAMLPEGSDLIPNPRGTAVGFAIRRNDTEYIALPGVPLEMKLMWQATVGPRLRARSSAAIAMRNLRVFGVGESTLGEMLGSMMDRGANPEVGTQVDQGTITVRALARAKTQDQAERMADAAAAEIRRLLGEERVFGENDDTIALVLARELERAHMTIAIAESCTGGLTAGTLTDVPGASRLFLEGAVTYSNDSKTARLGVPAELIRAKGAVSSEVAQAMARGMRERSGADIALGITGIAGPDGGTDTKPVGLVYVALATPGGVEVTETRSSGRRAVIKRRAAKQALNMARLYLIGLDTGQSADRGPTPAAPAT